MDYQIVKTNKYFKIAESYTYLSKHLLKKPVLPYLYKCLSRGVSNKLKTKHANTHHYCFEKKKCKSFCPFTATLLTVTKSQSRLIHTLQVRLDCSP